MCCDLFSINNFVFSSSSRLSKLYKLESSPGRTILCVCCFSKQLPVLKKPSKKKNPVGNKIKTSPKRIIYIMNIYWHHAHKNLIILSYSPSSPAQAWYYMWKAQMRDLLNVFNLLPLLLLDILQLCRIWFLWFWSLNVF